MKVEDGSLVSVLPPATVVAAVTIFVLKELIEATRRRRSDGRKRVAIRTLLAHECERNLWTIEALRLAIRGIQPQAAGKSAELSIDKDAVTGRFLLRIVCSEDEWSEVEIPDVHRETANRVIMDTALLDETLFERLIRAYDALADLEGFRTRFIHDFWTRDSKGAAQHVKLHLRKTFVEFALGELDAIYRSLDELYRECTGKKLTSYRFR